MHTLDIKASLSDNCQPNMLVFKQMLSGISSSERVGSITFHRFVVNVRCGGPDWAWIDAACEWAVFYPIEFQGEQFSKKSPWRGGAPRPSNKSASGLLGNVTYPSPNPYFHGGRRPTYSWGWGGGAPQLIPHHDY